MEATMQAKNTRTSANVSYILYTMLLSGVVMVVLYWVICHFLSRTSQSYRERRNSSKNSLTQKKTTSDAVSSYLTSKHEINTKRVKNKKKREPQEFSHHWKLTTLKGHTGSIYNMSVSYNCKYVASCAEGSARRENHNEFSGKQSFRRDNRIRTRRKKQKMDTASSDLAHKTQGRHVFHDTKKVLWQHYLNNPPVPLTVTLPWPGEPCHSVVPFNSQPRYPDLKDFFSEENNCSDNYKSDRFKVARFDDEIIHWMSLRLLKKEDFCKYGFPTKVFNTVKIFHTPYPVANNDLDSGHESSGSVEHSDQKQKTDIAKSSDSEKIVDSAKDLNNDKSCNSKKSDELSTNNQTLHIYRVCNRCKKNYYVDQKGNYVTEENCHYHWDKNRQCCESRVPCTTAKQHVWSGLVPGDNGPYTDFVYAPPPLKNSDDSVYGLDCEMCYTRNGLELARVSLVNMYGRVVYDEFVKPKAEIIDYNSRFSGITEEKLRNVTKTIEDVQKDIFRFIKSNTIVVGHGLEGDFRVLRLFHTKILDTSIMFSQEVNFPHRPGLKKLAARKLKRKIQESAHDSVEDSRAAMDLVMQQLMQDIADYEKMTSTPDGPKGSNISRKPPAKDVKAYLEYEKKMQIRREFKEIVKMRAEKK